MGLGDCIREEEVSPDEALATSSSSNTTRKKRTFDIAFLTGQSDELEQFRNQSEESCSGGSSDSSIIDILSEQTVSPPSSSTSHLHDRKKRKRKDKNTETAFTKHKIEDHHHTHTLPSSDMDTPKNELNKALSGTELIIPQLTSPFHFLPQFKSAALTHFGSYLPGASPLPSTPGSSSAKSRRAFPGHCAADQSPTHQSHFYPPYNPFLTSSSASSQAESTNQHTAGHPVPNHSPPLANPTTLLPSSLAALSLPAQNVCAKCKIGFRMTSDLVYHMRSHHKREADPQQKRREEKLKCPVCHETFRERHHLTRHMTAHEDRDDEEIELGRRNKV